MSEPLNPLLPAAAPSPPPPPVVPPRAETAPSAELTKALAEVEKWKALSRKNEEQAKGNAGAVTERDQLAERLSALEQQANKAEAKALRLTVAAEKGVPAHLLSGSTEQELAASADALLEYLGAQAPQSARSVTPQEAGAGRQGSRVALNDADGLEAALRKKLGIH